MFSSLGAQSPDARLARDRAHLHEREQARILPEPRALAAPLTRVLIDARNVLRSRWPNVPERDLVELIGRWAADEGVEAIAVFDGRAPEVESDACAVVGTGAESADEWLIREAARLREGDEPFWL